MSSAILCRCHLLILSLVLAVDMLPAVLMGQDQVSKYADQKFGFSLTVPDPWESARLQDYTVPGVIRAAWSGSKGASIVAFMQEPGMAYSPRFLVDASAQAQKEKLGAKVLAQEVKTVADKQAMWLVVEGKGNGGAITGTGDVPTTQHWVAIPREKDILVVLLSSPSADYESNRKSFQKVIDSLMIEGEQSQAQKEAK